MEQVTRISTAFGSPPGSGPSITPESVKQLGTDGGSGGKGGGGGGNGGDGGNGGSALALKEPAL